MGINEEIVELRKKMAEAVRAGFLDEENIGTYEQTLLQVMNQSERQRQNCINRAEQLKVQAATAEGQAAAFSMISSIINTVVGSMINKTVKMAEEERILAEDAEAGKEPDSEEEPKQKKVVRKRATKKTTKKSAT